MDYFVYMDCDPGHVAIGGIYFRNTLHRTLKIKRAVVAREPALIENGLHPITYCLIGWYLASDTGKTKLFFREALTSCIMSANAWRDLAQEARYLSSFHCFLYFITALG